VDVFVPAGSGGLSAPTDLTFGPDGNLYVSSWGSDRVLRYQGPSGAQLGGFIDAYVPPNDGGLTEPNGLLFDAGGSLYVASFNGNDVLRAGAPDYYAVTLSAGQAVTFDTLTPGDGPGQPANVLDPHIELYGPTQTLVATGAKLADGRNESITFTPTTSGTYYVKVSGQNLTEGDYVLDPGESGGEAETALPALAAAADETNAPSEFLTAATPRLSEAATEGRFALPSELSPTPKGTLVPTSAENHLPNGSVVGATAFTATGPDSSATLPGLSLTGANPNNTITQVAFYVTSNGSDVLLDSGTQTNPGVWTFTLTVNLSPGTYTLYAQAEDSYGVLGDSLALSLQVA
jgi:hypothetical protein